MIWRARRRDLAAEAFASAELLLALLPAALGEAARGFTSLARLPARHHWLRDDRASVR